MVNFVGLCVVSVGQASDQCWGSVCVCWGRLRLTAPVLAAAAMCTHIYLNTIGLHVDA